MIPRRYEELNNMDKAEKFKLLDMMLEETLSGENEFNARLLLREFIIGFTLKKKHDKTGGWWKQLGYKIIGFPLFAVGLARDLRVNRTVGRKLYGDFADHWGTFTKTLHRVLETDRGFNEDASLWHYKYGIINADKYRLAMLICSVLNDYDPGHCPKIDSPTD